MTQPPADDHRSDDLRIWAESFVIPDDISALEDDIAQWHAEQRALRAPRRRFRLKPTRLTLKAIRPYGVAILTLILPLTVAVALGFSTIVSGPRVSRPTYLAARPLATSTVPPGRVSGLVPATSLTAVDGTLVDLRSVRPAILTLVPTGCQCEAAVAHVAAAAAPYGVRQYVVAPDSETLVALKQTSRTSHGLIDRGSPGSGSLLDLYGGVIDKPTIVVVGADGTVLAVELAAGTNVALNSYLDTAIGAPLLNTTG